MKYLTAEGLEKFKKELCFLKDVKRKEISERLARASSFGDLSENSEYQETKDAQGFLEGRILELENLIKNAVAIKESGVKKYAEIGSTILVSAGGQKEKFKIVGAEEVNPLEGKISTDSPIGKAILSQPIGAIIEVDTPQGKAQYKILKIE